MPCLVHEASFKIVENHGMMGDWLARRAFSASPITENLPWRLDGLAPERNKACMACGFGDSVTSILSPLIG